MTTRQKEILTGVAIFALAGGVLLAAELSLWLLDPGSRGQREVRQNTSQFFTDKETGLRLATPNWRGKRIRVNNLGFRGPDITAQKPEGTFRIAFLGSSTTRDGRSPEGLNWPHLVVEHFRAAVSGCDLDFVNAGLPGYTFSTMAELYQRYVVPTDPDIIIVKVGGVIRYVYALAEQQGFKINRADLGAPTGQFSFLEDELRHQVNVIRYQLGAEERSEKLQVDAHMIAKELTKDLQALLEVVDDGERLVGVVASTGKLSENMSAREQAQASPKLIERAPFLNLPDLIAVQQSYNQMIPEAVQGYQAFALPGISDVPHNRAYFIDRVHFTLVGSRVMSERIFEQLIERQDVRSVLEQQGCLVR